MNRRSFFRKAVTVSAAAIAAPVVIVKAMENVAESDFDLMKRILKANKPKNPTLIYDLNALPDGMTISEVTEYWKQYNILLYRHPKPPQFRTARFNGMELKFIPMPQFGEI